MSNATLSPADIWPACRPALRIGVVGHARVPSGSAAAVVAASEAIFREIIRVSVKAIGRARVQGLYGAQVPVFRLLTCLAPGFDAWALDAWKRLKPEDFGGSAPELCVTGVLPTPRDVYVDRLESEGESRGEVEARIPAPPSLPVDHGLVWFDDGLPPVTDAARRSSDWQAARFLVHHSDVLVAYWNGERGGPSESGGPTGATSCTFRAIARAVELGIPVLWLPCGNVAAEALEPDAAGLRSQVTRVECEVGDGDVAHAERLQAACADAVRRSGLERMLAPYGDQRPPTRTPGLLSLIIEIFWSVPRLFHSWLRMRGWAKLASAAAHGAHGSSKEIERLKEETDPQRWRSGPITLALCRPWRTLMSGAKRALGPSGGDSESETPGALGQAYRLADARSGWFMDLYRGGFLMTYRLGPLAVGLAALAYMFKVWGAWPLAIATVVVECAVVLLILGLHIFAQQLRWQERATECRVVSEMFRHSHWLWKLGRPVRRVPLRRDAEETEPVRWTRWYHDAVVRSLDPGNDLPTVSGARSFPSRRSFDCALMREIGAGMRADWLENQADYHRRTASRYHFLHHRAEDAVRALFVLVLLAAGVSLVKLIWSGHSAGEDAVKGLILLIGVCFPALAAAAHGVSVQGEFGRLATASERTEAALRGLKSRVERALVSPCSTQQLVHALEPIAREASAIMLDELDDWHAAYSVHKPPL